MFDPSNRLYYRDAEGKYVSLRRLRDILANGETLIPNSDASHAGCGFNPGREQALHDKEHLPIQTRNEIRGRT